MISPLSLFDEWYKHCNVDHTAVLSTVEADHSPASRVVLVRYYDSRYLRFFTNLNSRKSCATLRNPAVALCFYWPAHARQVCIEGKAYLVADKVADEYFKERSRGKQIAAWSSKQSCTLESAEVLQERYEHYSRHFAHEPCVPRPQFWSGFEVIPHRIEFWTQGCHRMHKRQLFEFSTENNKWHCSYLYP